MTREDAKAKLTPPEPPSWMEHALIRIGQYPATVGYIAVMVTLIAVVVCAQALA